MAKFVRERKYGNPLHLLGMPKAIREQIGKARAMLSSSTAICAIVIYARRNENKFRIMHGNLLLDS